jgi:Family of unknown function (DUF6062)
VSALASSSTELRLASVEDNPTAPSLDDALAQEACPVCALISRSTKDWVDVLLKEHVTDGVTRVELVYAWGFCRRHGQQACEADVAPRGGIGVAVIYEELTERVVHILKAQRVDKVEPRKQVKRLAAPAGQRIAELDPEAPCPVCRVETEAEQRYAASLGERVRVAGFRERYAASHGVCLPHLRAALEQCQDVEAALFLATTARDKVRVLLHDVREYTRKHSWENRQEPKLPQEQDSARRAVAFEVGEKQ